MSTTGTTNILVFGATGWVGRALQRQLLKKGSFKVFAASRTAGPNSNVESGAVAVRFDTSSAESVKTALATHAITQVFFMLPKTINFGPKEGVVKLTKTLIDGCVLYGAALQHLVFMSVANCDTCPDGVTHFKNCLYVEGQIKATALSCSYLRPVAFFENFDDPDNWNPLKKGAILSLWAEQVSNQYVGCEDIAKAAVAMFSAPEQWRGRTLNCIGSVSTGTDLVNALSGASGVPCKWGLALPRCLFCILPSDLRCMIQWFESSGYTCQGDIAEFRSVVPDAMDAAAFFRFKGAWGNGEAFAPVPEAQSLNGK